MLAFADCVQNNGNVDSDIQRDYSGVRFTNWTQAEIAYWCDKLKSGVKCKVEPPFDVKKDPKGKVLLSDEVVEHSGVAVVLCDPAKFSMDSVTHLWYCTDNAVFIVPHGLADDAFLREHQLQRHMLATTIN